MNRPLPKKIFIVELVGFVTIILFLWLDEILDLPHLLFGAPPTPINITESVFETIIILFFGSVIGSITLRYSKELQSLHDEKDRFYSIISHDLRTPLSQLLLSTEMLEKKSNTFSREKIKQYSGTIHNSAKKLFHLLENLLQWARIQTGTGKCETEKIVLKELMYYNINLLSGNASKKKISLSGEIEAGTLVYADRTMLNSVIQNLLSNAIKFTRPGGDVKVSSSIRDKDVEIAVSDSGTGMDKESVNRMFSMDSCHSKPGTSGEKGTGLGLILCRELVEKMGGSIRVKSETGRGSTFIFTLPKAP